MIRHVADRKAILVGVAGAVAWEIVARLLIFVGMPFFSIVEALGAGAAERERVGISWSVGMLLHLIVGAIWTVSTPTFSGRSCRSTPRSRVWCSRSCRCLWRSASCARNSN